MKARVPSAVRQGLGVLEAHRLCFHKRGQDGSSKCDAFFTGRAEDCVWGVLYEIDPGEKPHLDLKEGLGAGYLEKWVLLRSPEGGEIEAQMYYATDFLEGVPPFSWYLHHVLRGLREGGVPPDYIEAIESLSATRDPDGERRSRELSIYGPGEETRILDP